MQEVEISRTVRVKFSLPSTPLENQPSLISPFFQLHLLVLIFAATTVIGRLVTVSAPVLVTWRCLLAALGAFLWVAIVRSDKLRLARREILKLLGIGVIIGLHWLCLFGAVKIANVSIALAGLATLSLFTAFTEPLFTRRRIRPFEVLLGLLVLLGILLIAGVETNHLRGLSIALFSALLAAIFLVLNRTVVLKGGDPMVMVGWEMISSTAVCFLAIPIFDPSGFPALLAPTLLDWFWIGVLAWGCTVFAQALTNHLLRNISAYNFNLAANFEPVWGILAAALIFNEHQNLKPAFYLGASAIVFANFLHPFLQRRFFKKPSASP
jgi:drug/metabolite transporter (DMT)-like permease